jgi:hypothetical protein
MGFILWLINYYVIAALFGWVWFPLAAHPLFQGLIGHTVFSARYWALILPGDYLKPGNESMRSKHRVIADLIGKHPF